MHTRKLKIKNKIIMDSTQNIQLICDNPKHLKSVISGVCFNKKCKNQKLTCFHCILFDHKDHIADIKPLGSLAEEINFLKK